MYLASKFFRFAFGVSGDKVAVPDDLDPSGYVSYEEGFPPDYELPKTDPSRKPVPRDETNQIYYDLSSAIQQYQKYSVPEFITSTDNGGVAFSYSLGVRVMYTADAGATWNIYRSIAAANTALPTDATKWMIDNEYPTADETTVGMAEVATQAEALAGTDDERIMTPLKVTKLFTDTGQQSLATAGYQKLPGGLILQWGYSGTNITSETTTTITFPIAFPTGVLYAGANTRNTAASTDQNVFFQEVSVSLTQFAFYNQGAPSSVSLTSNGYRWFAIGY